MDRRHLEYFVAVAERGAFTGAAQALHVSQPSLSQAIKALELELGTALFWRTARGVRLTAAGEALMDPARRALREFILAAVAVANVRNVRSGRLDLVTLPSLAADPLADLVADFHAAHPDVVVRIARSADTVGIEGLVRSGVYEVALSAGPCSGAGLEKRQLMSEPLYLVTPAVAGREPGSVVRIEDLADIGLVVHSASRPSIDELLLERGLTPRVVAETDHYDVVTRLVLRGVGAAILPASAARVASRHGAIVCRLDPAMHRQVVVLWRSGAIAPAAQAFLGMLWQPLHEVAAGVAVRA
jgi:LysR family carnitine catabolism transcriptional activator